MRHVYLNVNQARELGVHDTIRSCEIRLFHQYLIRHMPN